LDGTTAADDKQGDNSATKEEEKKAENDIEFGSGENKDSKENHTGPNKDKSHEEGEAG
jgi:hypothetical protein